MRTLLTALTLLVALPLAPAGQTPSQGPPAATESPLPIRRVVLYKTGVGYFEHLGTVRDRQDVAIRFTSAQLNDVLKSLTTIDLGKGRIAGISYNSIAPMEQRLGALRIPVRTNATAFDLLDSLRGARVEVTSAGAAVEGRLLSAERRTRVQGDVPATVESFSILTDLGEVRVFDLTPSVRVRIVDRDLRQEVGRYLDVVGSTREQDVRRMLISSTGSGERQLFVSYISEVPIWKSTYRLVVPEKGKPLLQGWAIVDNTIGEDWRDVELSLVAGAPQSFIQQISQPYYGRRPVVPLPQTAQMTPQTHQATLTSGQAGLSGVVRDPEGRALPGAAVKLTGPATLDTVSGADGRYQILAPPGSYTVSFELMGFRTQRFDVLLMAAGSVTQDATLELGMLTESVNVTATAPGSGGGRGGGAYRRSAPPAPLPEPAPYERLQAQQPAAQGGELGDLFEYRISEPVTLRKNQSALVPIVNAEVTAEKLVLWTKGASSGRPLRAVWLANNTGYTLDGGSVTVIEGNAFAGEGLVEPLKAGERRLVSYAAELGVLVSGKQVASPSQVSRLRVANGLVIHDMEERAEWTYTARNENPAPVALLIEHRTRPQWKVTADVPAAETTADTHRFRVMLQPGGKEASLVVREARAVQSSISIGELTDQYLAAGMRAGFLADDLLRALKPVIDKRVELAAVERRYSELDSQEETITKDQERLRENMKALRGSSEEKQLLQRYTRELNAQEDRLEALRKDKADAAAARSKLQADLSALIEKISFERAGAS